MYHTREGSDHKVTHHSAAARVPPTEGKRNRFGVQFVDDELIEHAIQERVNRPCAVCVTFASQMASLRKVVATAEIFLQPAIEGDEQVATAHLLDLEFRFACASIAPGDGNYCPGISSHDGLQW